MAMDILVSAVVSDLISRSASFLIKKCSQQPDADKNLQRLSRLLLRAHAIVEEAEGRRITNQAMLWQLKMLTEGFYRGHFMLDIFKFRALPGGSTEDEEEASHSSAMSKIHPAKRVRSSSTNTKMMLSGGNSATELHEMADFLETIIADMKEFVVFLGSYPRMNRQPYCTYLFLDNCMFGRQMERERVLSFLLHPEAAPGSENLAVLPIVGPQRVGKSTLVEHVCRDEMVRDHFSMILFFRENSLNDAGVTDLRESGLVKHQNSHASQKRLLIVIELAGDIDEETWKRVIYSTSRKARGSKIIITSRSKKITKFGTVETLWLDLLPPEVYWHFFKTLAFGTANPDEQPKLASMTMEIATEQRQCFVSGYIVARLLRDNLDARFWRAVLRCVRAYKRKHLLLFDEHPNVRMRRDEPVYYWRLGGSGRYFLICDYYQTDSCREDVAEVTVQDVLLGRDAPRGRFEALGWTSRLPPYYNYMISCVSQESGSGVGRMKRKALDLSGV
ncbi:putative disease resistance protein RGA3 [Phragmites australis]|uniref:putative disease resistance protein RGA3 n=1 Tax=Phragmites australis TaxID=29695 RepID=UPI002D76D824|nr:putative disease resistance protein RGA3 [Phragmites australis]